MPVERFQKRPRLGRPYRFVLPVDVLGHRSIEVDVAFVDPRSEHVVTKVESYERKVLLTFVGLLD